MINSISMSRSSSSLGGSEVKVWEERESSYSHSNEDARALEHLFLERPSLKCRQRVDPDMDARGEYRVVSLFSGAMGLELGLERIGLFETRACVESESKFCETIQRNRDAGRIGRHGMLIINADIRTLEPQDLLERLKMNVGELDLLAGGPPCQAFSVFGKRRGLEDSRGQLIFEFVRFVQGMLQIDRFNWRTDRPHC